MTTRRDALLQELRDIRSELSRMLEGTDYCLDWKPEDEEWSAREIVYHMVDTPSGGIHAAIQGILDGSVKELPIASSQTNLTPERREKDLDKIREDVEAVLEGMEKCIGSTADAELAERKVPLRSLTRGTVEDRTAQNLIDGIFVRHWREHLEHLAKLRESLGLE